MLNQEVSSGSSAMIAVIFWQTDKTSFLNEFLLSFVDQRSNNSKGKNIFINYYVYNVY